MQAPEVDQFSAALVSPSGTECISGSGTGSELILGHVSPSTALPEGRFDLRRADGRSLRGSFAATNGS